MLHIYADADSIGHFRESWQQLRQLSTCAHLLILCHAAGEFHSTEATRLWHMLIGFLERHQVMWPTAVGLCLSLRKAAGVFGKSACLFPTSVYLQIEVEPKSRQSIRMTWTDPAL